VTVADLIRELQAMPQQLQVRVVTGTIMLGADSEPYEETLGDEDATEADEVRHMGPWVLIRGK